MSKWKEVRISDLGKVVAGGTPSTKKEEYWNGNIPWLTPKDLSDYNKRYIKYGERNISKKGLENSSARLLPKDTLLFTSRAPIGYVAIADNEICTNQGFKNIICDKNIINVNFLYYYFKINIEYIKLFASGATFPEISGKRLKNIKIKIPDLETQEKIAQVLSSYDELIENNNRRIDLLENMAEEIYKEWFVRMRFPGHEEVSFEKGIPEGWEVKKIGDVINFDIGGGWGKEIYEDNYMEPAHVIRGTDIPDMKYGLFNFENLRYHKENNLEKRKLMDGDIIFEASGGSSNQRLGRTLYITDDILKCYDEEVICASFCKLIRVENYILRWYIKNYLEYAYKTELLSTFEVQSTGISNFGFSNFKKLYSLLIPDKVLLEKFYLLTYQMYSKQINLGIQNQNLIKQRDMLLPRLMNGTIEVK